MSSILIGLSVFAHHNMSLEHWAIKTKIKKKYRKFNIRNNNIKHFKKRRGQRTRWRVYWGHNLFQVKSEPEFGQLSADLTYIEVRLTQLWVIFRAKLTDFQSTSYSTGWV